MPTCNPCRQVGCQPLEMSLCPRSAHLWSAQEHTLERLTPCSHGRRNDVLVLTVAAAGSWFDIAVETTNRAALPMQVWADDSDAFEDGSDLQEIMPIKTVALPDGLQLQFYLKC